MGNLSSINMPYSLFKSKPAQPAFWILQSAWYENGIFLKSVLNLLPFNFVKCLPVLVLWNREKRRLWVMLLITLGWKPDPSLTGKWQICLFGFRSRERKIAGNQPCAADGSSLEGLWVMGGAQKGAAQEPQRCGAGEEQVCGLCAVSPAPGRHSTSPCQTLHP